MSNQEHFPEDNQGPTREQLKHSGVHGYEKPVDEFDNTSLQEAVEQGLVSTPEDTDHPALQEVVVPTPQKEKVSKWKKGVAAVVGLAALGGGGYALASGTGGSDETAPDQRPTASAPEKPGTINSENTTLEQLNAKATPETIQEALAPVTVADYPSPEDAIKRLGQIWNVMYLSGDLNSDNEYTPESLETQEALFRNIYGSSYEANYPVVNASSDFRRNIAGAFDEIKIVYSGNEVPAWHSEFNNITLAQNDNNSYSFKGTLDTEQNLSALVTTAETYFTDYEAQPINSYNIEGALYVEEGTWHLKAVDLTKR